ncbi:MAG: hypothetical protein JST83_08580, partial [Bacteroidetes bacterium]|nr:hypothetical protein [Bacteroidota bacterium]
MPQKKDTIKFLLCLLILLSSGYAFSLEAYDDDNIYTGYDYARLDSAMRSTAARYAHYPASTTLIRQLAELYTARSETDS